MKTYFGFYKALNGALIPLIHKGKKKDLVDSYIGSVTPLGKIELVKNPMILIALLELWKDSLPDTEIGLVASIQNCIELLR